MNGLRLGKRGYRWELTMRGYEEPVSESENDGDIFATPEGTTCCAQASPAMRAQGVMTPENLAHGRFLALSQEDKLAAVQEGLTPLAKAHMALLNVDWATIVKLAIQGGIGVVQGVLQAIFAGTQAPAPLPAPAPVPTGK